MSPGYAARDAGHSAGVRTPLKPLRPLTKALYRFGIGGPFSRRLLRLTHRGRVSGRSHHVLLEIVDRGALPGSYLVAAAHGERAQWMRNVLAEPRVRYQVGHRTYDGLAVPLDPEESGRRLAEYALRHPRPAARLMASLGRAPRTSVDYETLGADRRSGVPLVLLKPRRPGDMRGRG